MTTDDTRSTLDRRALIKKAAAAGAAAWVAPALLDSVLSPAAAQSVPPTPVPTGIRFVNASNQGGAVTLTYGGTPTATTATSSPSVPSGNGRYFEAFIQLIDQFGNPITNTTGGPITVSFTRSGGNGGPTPTTLTIASGATTSTTGTRITFANGSSTQATITGTATVNSQSVSAVVSSTTP